MREKHLADSRASGQGNCHRQDASGSAKGRSVRCADGATWAETSVGQRGFSRVIITGMPILATALPAEGRGWILYSGAKEVARGKTLHEIAARKTGVAIGVPAHEVTTFAVTLPTTNPVLFADMAHAQIEKRGLAGATEADTVFDWEVIDRREKTTVLAIHALRPDLDEDLVLTRAAGYTPSALLRESPGSGCLVWREHQRFVLALFHEGQLVLTQVLTTGGEVGSALAGEINLTLMALEADEALEGLLPELCSVVSPGASRDECAAFEKTSRLPVEWIAEGRATSRPRVSERLVPRAVSAARAGRRNWRRGLVAGAVLFFLYFAIALWVVKSDRATEREIASLEKRIAIIEPDVEQVQRSAQRWRALEPAFELDAFPVVQLSRITAALPGSGVVVREYRTGGREIRVRGQARDVQFANRLLEDLEAMEEFEGYEWNMPNPRVEGNNTATFELEGKPVNAGTDN